MEKISQKIKFPSLAIRTVNVRKIKFPSWSSGGVGCNRRVPDERLSLIPSNHAYDGRDYSQLLEDEYSINLERKIGGPVYDTGIK